MSKSYLFLLAAILVMVHTGHSQGISFQHNVNWKQILEKAKEEKKFIFLDCYTTWCLPCKKMSKDIFPLKMVGDYMNQHFINAKVQMDISDKDSDDIKAWYDQAKKMKQTYEVTAYPTFLFFSPEGKLVYKISTSFADPQTFISTAQIAIEPDKEVSKLLKQYNEGVKDTAVLKYLAVAARNENNKTLAIQVSRDYAIEVLRLTPAKKMVGKYMFLANAVFAMGNDSLAFQLAKKYIINAKNLFTRDNIIFMANYTNSLNDPGFKIFLQHYKRLNQIMKAEPYNYAVDLAKNIIIKHDRNFTALKDSTKIPNWDKILKNLIQKYGPLIADKALGFYKRNYYKERNQWPEYVKSLIYYIDKYPLSITISGYNEFAWDVFVYSDDTSQLAKALTWSQKTLVVNNEENYRNMDTYANLLYKLGRKAEAIALEERALKLASMSDKELYQRILNKMKNGEKTWD